MTPIEQKAAEAVAIYLNPDIDEASKYVAMARVMAELQEMFRDRAPEPCPRCGNTKRLVPICEFCAHGNHLEEV